MKNNIFPIKERTMKFFEEKNIFREIIELLKNDKGISICLYFKDVKLIVDFISKHAHDIEYLNNDTLKELSIDELKDYFNNQNYANIILSKSNDYISFCIAIDKKGFYLEKADVMIVPIISTFNSL